MQVEIQANTCKNLIIQCLHCVCAFSKEFLGSTLITSITSLFYYYYFSVITIYPTDITLLSALTGVTLCS